MEGLLSEKLAISAEKNTLMDQVAEFEPIYKEVMSKEHEIIMVLNRGKDVMAKSSKADASSIKKNLDSVDKSWQKVKKIAQDRQTRLNTCMEYCKKFYGAQDKFLPWLSKAESVVAKMEVISMVLTEIKKQEKELQAFRNDVNSHASEFDSNYGSGAVITCCAKLYVWELGGETENMKVVMRRESIDYLLQPGNVFVNEDDEEQELDGVRVTKLSFTEPDGKVLIVTSSGKTFVYKEDLGAWLKLADTYSWVQCASNYSSALSSSQSRKDNANMPLASLSYNNASNVPKLQSLSSDIQRLASVTHCQEQAVAALHLGSKHEYRFWYLKYMEHLAQGGLDNISQIRGELSCLLRKSESTENRNNSDLVDRRELFKSSLKIIGGNIDLQRVYAEYDEQMKCGWGASSEDVKDVDNMIFE
jgi:hypothetical protein